MVLSEIRKFIQIRHSFALLLQNFALLFRIDCKEIGQLLPEIFLCLFWIKLLSD